MSCVEIIYLKEKKKKLKLLCRPEFSPQRRPDHGSDSNETTSLKKDKSSSFK